MKKNNSAIIVGAVLILIGVFVVGRVFDLITLVCFLMAGGPYLLLFHVLLESSAIMVHVQLV